MLGAIAGDVPMPTIPMASDPLTRLRALCLALPEAHEALAWGEPTFRVRDKLFAMYAGTDRHGRGRTAVWLKATPENQAFLVEASPARYFVPPYVGPSGWVGVWLDRRPPWREVADLLRDAYCRTAPKRLVAQVARGPHGARETSPDPASPDPVPRATARPSPQRPR